MIDLPQPASPMRQPVVRLSVPETAGVRIWLWRRVRDEGVAFPVSVWSLMA